MIDAAPAQESVDPDGLPPRPDLDEDPPTVDAHRVFLATLVAAAVFIAAVVSFVLTP